MKRLLVSFIVGAAVASAASALALSSGQRVLLQPGGSAYLPAALRVSGLATCTYVSKKGLPTFSCVVAGDPKFRDRKKFGVTISSREVTVNAYSGPNYLSNKPHVTVIFQRNQGVAFHATR